VQDGARNSGLGAQTFFGQTKPSFCKAFYINSLVAIWRLGQRCADFPMTGETACPTGRWLCTESGFGRENIFWTDEANFLQGMLYQ
jgi:hypothetical protein